MFPAVQGHLRFDLREINTGNDHVLFLFILEKQKTPDTKVREPAVSVPSWHGPPVPDRRRLERPVSNPERHNTYLSLKNAEFFYVSMLMSI